MNMVAKQSARGLKTEIYLFSLPTFFFFANIQFFANFTLLLAILAAILNLKHDSKKWVP